MSLLQEWSDKISELSKAIKALEEECLKERKALNKWLRAISGMTRNDVAHFSNIAAQELAERGVK